MIIIPKDDFNFEGSGYKGAEFEQKGQEDRNLTNLLTILSNKTTQKSVEALSKIDKTEWASIAETSTNLRSIVEGGGLESVFGSMVDQIYDAVKLKIDELTSPLTNEITAAINTILDPFILLLSPVINNLTQFFIENPMGTGVGGIAGGVIGAFLGSPAIGAMIGGLVGASLEAYFAWANELYADEAKKGSLIGFEEWRKNNNWRGSWDEYLAWVNSQTPPVRPPSTFTKRWRLIFDNGY